MKSNIKQNGIKASPYLGTLGAWALAFGCAVGWGAFVMPGNTFLPIAGPVGSAIGLVLGGIVMIILAANYSYLINRYPDKGGAYSYTKNCFGYDHGFISAWFLILTYIAIIWANASALPLIARTIFGSTFQFGFHYVIAGYHVYFGELLLAIAALVISAFVCLNRRLSVGIQIVMALALFFGVTICFAVAFGKSGSAALSPAYSHDGAFKGITTIFALAPWAYVGFESISHSAAEAKFPLKNSFKIMVVAVITAAAAYAFLVLLAVTALPAGTSTWLGYISNLGSYVRIASVPTFFGAYSAMGNAGTFILGFASLGGIVTGLIGNYIALSRLISALAEDKLFPESLGQLEGDGVPKKAILAILAVSVIFPFFGRTAISWIVDVTTVGATIAYALTSAAAYKTAKEEENSSAKTIAAVGFIISMLFAVGFLVPNIMSVKTLSNESYLILAAWGILGFLTFHHILRNDTTRRIGRSTVAWIILLGITIFTSTVWMRQETQAAIDAAEVAIDIGTGNVEQILGGINTTMLTSIFIQMGIIVAALVILFDIYAIVQKRESQIEVEKAIAEDISRAKTSFLSNMSHEIRTPMNAIIGLDNIALREPDLPERTRDLLEKIGLSAKHLLGLINDILDMSRIESGKTVLKNEEFSLKELLDQVSIIIKGQCDDKNLNYECNVLGDVSDYYVGDGMKLKQVMINILGNSVKFTESPGKVQLDVSEIAAEGDRRTLQFKMSDTGVGMDAEFIPKIFEAFSMEDSSATNKYGGTGLGMAITKNFVDMMDGEINVESEKGVGSVFTVTVNLGASDRKYVSERQDENADGLDISAILAGRRVLMAEDVEQNAEILEDLLGLE
ncbi:MAG: amino acid permease, partial [Firmicutes bacterium]|nr:amino acid permease [Bacillota bacterium]